MAEDVAIFPWHLYFTVISVALGACVGSFLNVCIYRIPLEQSVVSPPSHCFSCGKGVAPYDNIPIFSYLILGGKCRHCKAGYSPRYMFVEILVAALFFLIWCGWGDAPRPFGLAAFGSIFLVPVYWLFCGLLVLGAFVDLDHRIIPDRVTIGGTILGLLCSVLVPSLHGVDAVTWWDGLRASLIGAAMGFGLLWGVGVFGKVLFRRDAMGFGDVKLMAGVGAFLGWDAVLFTLMFGSLFGAVIGITMILVRGRDKQEPIPFGPFLSSAALLWVFWGQGWWDAYVSMVMGDRLLLLTIGG